MTMTVPRDKSGSLPPVVAGALLMIAAMFCFVVLDAVLKHLVARHDPLLLAWIRCLVQFLALAALIPFLGRTQVLGSKRPLVQVGRGIMVVLASVCMIVASRSMQLSEIYTIAFAAPLLAALIARIGLGEPVSRRQWLLIATGFAGVLVAIGPAAPAFGLLALLPVLQAASNASYHVLTRVAATTDPPYAQLFYSGLFATALLATTLPWTIAPIPIGDALLLVGGSLIVTFGHLLLIRAFAIAPTAAVSPMIYFQIVWATLFGWLVFGDVPSLGTAAGAAIVVASGIALIRSRA